MGEVRRGSNLFPFPNRQDGTFHCYKKKKGSSKPEPGDQRRRRHRLLGRAGWLRDTSRPTRGNGCVLKQEGDWELRGEAAGGAGRG